MLGSGHLISGLDIAAGTFALMVFSLGAALVVLVVLATFVFRRAGQSGMAGSLWVCGLALVGALLAYTLLDRSAVRDQAAERRAIEARAAELTARSLAPGSALACLDAVASVVVETACEKPLFANPEAVAAAVAYVDARFSLLAPSVAIAERDPSYQPVVERLRRALEADRFGLVAHVLTTRGCNGADCAELRLLHDPARVVANMKVRAFDTSLGAHTLAWQQNGTGVAAVASAPPASVTVPPLTTTGTSASVSSGAAGSSRFDFPSANSIPAVSIMSAEPGPAPASEPRPTALPPKRPAATTTPATTPSPRRQSAREVAPAPPPPQRAPQPTPPPPAQGVPESAPAEPAQPDPHSSR